MLEESLSVGGGCENPPPYTPIIKRVQIALETTGHHNQWEHIKNCSHPNYCGSIYCLRCSSYQKKKANERLQSLFQHKYDGDDVTALNDLRHATVLCEVVDLDQSEVYRVITDNQKSFDAMRRKFPGLIIEGRHEIEIIDIKNLYRKQSSPRKITSIEYLTAGMSRYTDSDRVLVHFHALISLNGHNHSDVLSLMEKRWPGDHCVFMTGLYKNKSVESSLKTISSYPIKNSHRYNLNSEYESDSLGSYLNNESLSFRILCDKSLGRSMRIRTNKW